MIFVGWKMLQTVPLRYKVDDNDNSFVTDRPTYRQTGVVDLSPGRV